MATDLLTRYAMVLILVVLACVSDILYPGFFDSGNLRNILSQNAPIGIVAIGMTFVIIAGGFDLSVGAIYAAGSLFFAGLAAHVPVPLALVAALLVGMAAGTINGTIVTRLKVNAFVATLGTSSVFTGLALIYSHSAPITADMAGFDYIGSANWAGIPVAIFILAAVFVVASVVLSRTVYGRSVYATGGSIEAARLSGIRVDLIRASTYMITGVCAALAGAIIASRTGVGQGDIGADVTLDAIAMVIIGGTSLFGGEGAMWRTLVGLLILATINNLFDSLALESSVQLLVKGLVVIGAVSLDAWTRTRRA
jgi:ribose transport system permease protein